MLRLNRKEGQAIYVGDGQDKVTIIVSKVNQLPDGKFDVQLSCEGPRYISIDREEVRDKKIKTIKSFVNGNH